MKEAAAAERQLVSSSLGPRGGATLTPPFVSVLMPVFNEADFISRSLGAVLAQSYPPSRYEVIVIDGGSTDGTRELVLSITRATNEPAIRLIDNPRRTTPSSLNAGLAYCRGDVIARVDGHCVVRPDYLGNGVAHLSAVGNRNIAGVGGPLLTIPHDGKPSAETSGGTTSNETRSAQAEAIAGAMSSRFGVGGSAFRTAGPGTEPRDVDTVAFPIYRRTAIENAGAYDEELVRNQDDEYNYRQRSLGRRIRLFPDLPATYYSRASLQSLWRQYFQYGFYKVRVLQKHPRQMKLRQFVPALFVAACGGSATIDLIVAVNGWAPPIALTTLLASYALALAVATVLTARTAALRPAARRVLPLVFLALHVGYGSGFLWGLVRFAFRWRDRRGHVPQLRLGAPPTLGH